MAENRSKTNQTGGSETFVQKKIAKSIDLETLFGSDQPQAIAGATKDAL
jgi:hypothetical protein